MESGLDYSHFRMLSSSVGRWASTDPEMGDLDNPQTLNRYGYVANNPLNFVDPQGSFQVAPLQDFSYGGGGGGLPYAGRWPTQAGSGLSGVVIGVKPKIGSNRPRA